MISWYKGRAVSLMALSSSLLEPSSKQSGHPYSWGQSCWLCQAWSLSVPDLGEATAGGKRCPWAAINCAALAPSGAVPEALMEHGKGCWGQSQLLHQLPGHAVDRRLWDCLRGWGA